MKGALLIVALVLLIRLPFLNQAVQGDDVYYLAQAEHAQVDPWHPQHVHYLFEGRDVDFRGYPHPPLNAWVLAGLLAIFGDVKEVPFHAVYIAFSLVAALSMLSLARRFTVNPVWATVLFVAVPAFVINGNSFEADIPFLAFWMAGLAAFVASRWLLAAVALALAVMAAPQAVLAVPILAAYLKLHGGPKRAWLVASTPVVVFASWQCLEYLSSGRFPAAITAGYLQSYGYERVTRKLANTAMLGIHAGFIVSPLLLYFVIRARRQMFLHVWMALFFAGALLLFYSGSARYLLPMAAPVAILASTAPRRWLIAGFAAQMTISLGLAAANYQHANAYREFAASLAPEVRTRHVWANAEWGLRWYLEAEGALAIAANQPIPADDLVVSSELAYPAPFSHGGAVPVTVARREIRPGNPFRVIGLTGHSGFSTVDKGFFPFGLSFGAIDRVKADVFKAQAPAREYLSMAAPGAEVQLLSGVFSLEENRWRWMGKEATVVLKSPAVATPLHVEFFIPETVPARSVALRLDGVPILTRSFSQAGQYSVTSVPVTPKLPSAILTIEVDKTYSTPADSRELGMILTEAGFRK